MLSDPRPCPERNTRYPGMACVADTPFPDPLGTTSAMSSWYRPCQNFRPMHAKKDSTSSPQQWKHKDLSLAHTLSLFAVHSLPRPSQYLCPPAHRNIDK